MEVVKLLKAFRALLTLWVLQCLTPVRAQIDIEVPGAETLQTFANIVSDSASNIGVHVAYLGESVMSSLGMGSAEDENTIPDFTTYDYIVVGAGAAGAPAARTLANDAHNVLLIERGPRRSKQRTPNAMDIYGAGIAVADSSISQLIITKQGVRSHIGSVMGGGTAINMAIVIEEEEKYFQYLNDNFDGVDWDYSKVQAAYQWINLQVATPMPESPFYGPAWKRGLAENGFTPNNDPLMPSLMLQDNKSWQGMSLFDAFSNFFRNSSDVVAEANGSKSISPPPAGNLDILAEHTVLKIEFAHEYPPGTFGDFEIDEERPRAVCVVFRPTQSEDFATINSRKDGLLSYSMQRWMAWVQRVLPQKFVDSRFFKWFSPNSLPTEHRACIPPNGEIILSAGAVLSPVILYKSGIGPREQIEELGVPLVKEFPTLGQELSDRVLIPVGMFHQDNAPPAGFPTRICQAIGFKMDGDCANYEIGNTDKTCSVSPAEELAGSHIGEYVIYATRFIFPPEFRHHPVVEYLFNLMVSCSNKPNPKSIFVSTACQIANPVIQCFRRVVANFYFTAEPKSRGNVKVNKNGDISVNPNYMKEDQDLIDAVRGVSSLIRIAKSDVYRGIMQEGSQESCPITVLNRMLDMVLQLATYINPDLSRKGQFRVIEKHLETLIPRAQRISVLQEAHILVGLGDYRSDGEEAANVRSTTQEVDPVVSDFEKVLESYIETQEREADPGSVRGDTPFSERDEQPASIFSPETEARLRKVEEMYMKEDDNDDADLRGAGYKPGIDPEQWVASYPPTLPDTGNPTDVARYVLSYMTSIWHFAGSAEMGKVVDKDFNVIGVDGLSIIDASVLNQVTRMNPTATLMMLGRYGGQSKLEERNLNNTTTTQTP